MDAKLMVLRVGDGEGSWVGSGVGAEEGWLVSGVGEGIAVRFLGGLLGGLLVGFLVRLLAGLLVGLLVFRVGGSEGEHIDASTEVALVPGGQVAHTDIPVPA
jgi:hypothetical protein